MKESSIPTAKQYYLSKVFPTSFVNRPDEIELWLETNPDAQQSIEAMIEFARLHVTEALQEASEKVTCDGFFEEYNEDNLKLDMDDNYEATFVFPLLTGGRVFDVNKSSIINSYPLENIK